MRHISAIFRKQFKDTVKNPVLLLQFVLFPAMILLLNNTVNIEDLPENYFTEMFSVMYVGMAPLITMSNIVSEEKEKGTLRALFMCGVNPLAYLAGIGLFIFCACALGITVIVIQGGYTAAQSLKFALFTLSGCLISEILGANIGISRNSQVSATGLAVPIMSVISFVPMLSMFNERIEKLADIVYTYRIKCLISDISCDTIDSGHILAILSTLGIVILLFVLNYRKNGLE